MSISFSGIASGLDTSSWIESLVALRRAKITTLKTQREELVSTQDTLNNIRSFFNTFKATIQKITDSKFGDTSLFGRNTATSSNLGVLSATVNDLAQAATYQIKVDQLATNTTAMSGFKETIIENSVANESTFIRDLGGGINITDGMFIKVENSYGVSKNIGITNSTTIGSLLNNMRDVGLDANIDNRGVITVSNGAIVGGTQVIRDALGFTSNVTNSTAQTDRITYEVAANVDWGTKLGEIIDALGTQDQVSSGYNLYFNGENIFVTDQSTLNDIATLISGKGGEVALTDGQLIVNGGTLTGTVANALGFTYESTPERVYNSVTSTAPITYVNSAPVELTTKIGDLEGVRTYSIAVYDQSGHVTDISYSTTDSVETPFSRLWSEYDIDVSIRNGAVSVTNWGEYYIQVQDGDLFDALGITTATSTHGISNTSSAAVTYTKTVAANGSTTLGELGCTTNQTIKINKSYVTSSGTVSTTTVTTTLTFNTGATLNQVFDQLANYDIKASINGSGVISVDEQLGATIYTANTSSGLFKTLNMQRTVTLTTVGITATSTEAIKYNSNNNIVSTTKLGDIVTNAAFGDGTFTLAYNPTAGGGLGLGSNKGYTVKVTATADMTVSQFFNEINKQAGSQGYTVTGSVTNGVISIDTGISGSVPLASGDLADYFGSIAAQNGANGHTVLAYDALKRKATILGSTTLSQITGLNSNLAVTIKKDNNNKTITINATDTVTQMLSKFQTAGFTTSISDGKISITGGENLYIMDNTPGNISFKNYFSLGDTYQAQVKATMTPSGAKTYEKTVTMNESTTLADLGVIGNLTLNITNNGATDSLVFNKTINVGEMKNQIADAGFTVSVQDGKLTITGNERVWVNSSGNDDFNSIFKMNSSNYASYNTHNVASGDPQYYGGTVTANASTSLADLGLDGDATIRVVHPNNGDQVILTLSRTDTLASVVQKLTDANVGASFDVNTGKLTFTNSENGYIKSMDPRLLNIFHMEYNENSAYTESYITSNTSADLGILNTTNVNLSTKLADLGVIAGGIILNIDGVENIINISVDNNKTVQDFLNLLGENGITSRLEDGRIFLSAAADISFDIPAEGASNILAKLGLNNLVWTDTFEHTSKELKVTSTRIEYTSAAKFANENTTLKTLGITDGELVLQKGGNQVKIEIDSNKTFSELNSDGIEFTFEDGHLKISATNGDKISLISSVSSTNFASITGLSHKDDGTIVGSKKLYCVNLDSVIVESGIFKEGDVNEGSFKVGNLEITIDENTTIKDVINQINSSDQSNATARWDENNARLILESRISGNGYIYVGKTAMGSSNFTDILGFTNGNSLVFENQEQGKLAEYYIGNQFKTAQTNILDSTLTGIAGVTINLKGLSENGEYTTLTIEKDKETIANAVSDMVDSYNTLVENIDKELAKGSDSKIASTLKLLKNQIRSYMKGVHANDGKYNSMYDIGISTKSATAGNISTNDISGIVFDKEKFMQAYSADSESVQKLLVGTEANKGVFWQLEEIVNTAVGSTTGYFSTTNSSYNKQISRLDDRIRKAEKDISVYKQRLENKFNAMELLITKMQDQYSSFLNTGFMM